MNLRSLLFVPGDSDKKLAKAMSSGADALILDLEDSVAPSQKATARARVGEFLVAHAERGRIELWVRINPIDTAEALEDLAIVLGGRPDGIVQPKAQGASDVLRLAGALDVQEQRRGLTLGCTKILPITTETPAALFALGDYQRCGPRLAALTWGAEDLSAELGAAANRGADGRWTAPYQLARSLCLFGAAAAAVPAIDTVHVDYHDLSGLREDCRDSTRDGFVARMAVHPDQVNIINESYTPSRESLERAAAIVALFRAHPGTAALPFEGRMVDIPHFKLAEKLLNRVHRS